MQLKEEKLEKYLAILLTLMVCITRLSMALGQIFYAFSIALGLYMWHKQGKLTFPHNTKIYLKIYMVFFVSLLPSVICSGNILRSFGAFINIFGYRAMPFILILCFIRKKEYIINMLRTFMYVTCIDCLVVAYQLIRHYGTGYWVHARGWGFGSNTLTIAGIMVMLTPIVLVFLYDPTVNEKLKKAAKTLLPCLLIGLWGNKSRSTWLFIPITVIPLLWQYVRKNRKQLLLLVLVIALLGGGMVANSNYRTRFLSIANTTTDLSNRGRIDTCTSTLNMIKDHPVVGVGIGEWRPQYLAKYKFEREIQNLPHCHNNALMIAGEAGVLGFLGYIYFLIHFMIISFKNWRKDENPYDLIIFSILIGYLGLFGQIEYVLDNSSGMRIFWFLIACMLQLKALTQPHNVRS